MQPGTAVKSFIVNDKRELLLIKRSEKEYYGSVWEIPGGRLEKGEDAFAGLKREVKEETGIEIEILNPLKVHNFTRKDSQRIRITTFLCMPISESVALSSEHTEYYWTTLEKAKSMITPFFREEIELLQKHFHSNL
ncbi:MAG: NUDIX domain-containing protein [Candidatus Woesearchaeota archaeon]|nr:NUDIX domain-containing protein [Candidatus Woesearchaeota archaeon]